VARVPEAELERIKREVSIVRLVEARGVKLSGSGDNLMGLCPLPGHDDRSPSLVVSPSKNIWHCLGACQTGGSVIDWVMRAEGVSFRLAVEMLRKRSPSLAAEQAQPGTRPKLDVLAKAREPDAAVLRRVVDLYHATAKESPEVKAYLETRPHAPGADRHLSPRLREPDAGVPAAVAGGGGGCSAAGSADATGDHAGERS